MSFFAIILFSLSALILIIYLCRKNNNILNVREIVSQHFKIINIDKFTSVVFIGLPIIISAGCVCIRTLNEKILDSINIALPIYIGLQFSVVGVLCSLNKGNDKYEELLPGTHHLTIMPNTPAKVLEGTTLFEKDNTLTAEELNYVQTMFESIGEVYLIENYQMVAGGALSGCGPAFVYMFIEALADGAVLNGLPRDLAYKLASQTVLGSAKMVKETQLHPGILKDQVCSPGGITIQGVKALEENNFRNAVMEAIDCSKK